MTQQKPTRRGRPRGAVKPQAQKRAAAIIVRMTPNVFACVKNIVEEDGANYSDTARALIIEALRARGVLQRPQLDGHMPEEAA